MVASVSTAPKPAQEGPPERSAHFIVGRSVQEQIPMILRESPALTIFELLQKQGAEVSYNDPYMSIDRQGA